MNYEGLVHSGFIGFDYILGQLKNMRNFQCSVTNYLGNKIIPYHLTIITQPVRLIPMSLTWMI